MGKDQRVVLVTGGSTGFGQSICTRLAGAGYTVYGTSRRKQPQGGPFPFVEMNIDSDESVSAGVAEVVRREGRLDAIVGNAGRGIAGALEDTSTEEAISQFQTNFFGNHRLCRAALPYLRQQELAHIVIVGSLAGLVGIPFQGMYSASKFALEGYCQSLRLELRNSPVRVSILEPGDFNTGFTSARVMVEASGPGSLHEEAFRRALAVFEEEESSGGDPQILSRVVQEILEDAAPPFRHIVTGPKQEDLKAIRQFGDEDVEGLLAGMFID